MCNVKPEIAGKKSIAITKAVKCSQGTYFTFAIKFLYDVRQITELNFSQTVNYVVFLIFWLSDFVTVEA